MVGLYGKNAIERPESKSANKIDNKGNCPEGRHPSQKGLTAKDPMAGILRRSGEKIRWWESSRRGEERNSQRTEKPLPNKGKCPALAFRSQNLSD